MLTPDGAEGLEYNVRFGDPECQVIVPRLASPISTCTATSRPSASIETPVVMRDDACVGVVLATRGLPARARARATRSTGSTAAAAHAGRRACSTPAPRAEGDAIVTNGGRVLTVSATGADVAAARDRAYEAAAVHLVARPPLPSRHRRPSPAHVIPRYSPPEIAELFTDEARFAAWLEVEVLAVEAWAELGVVPAEHARTVRERAGFDVAAVHEREQVTDHDVAAFVDVVQATRRRARGRLGPLRPDVERRRRHRARAADDARARRDPPGGGAARSGDRGPRARVPRHADGRSHARHPRRADDVRRQARALGDAGPARPRAAAARARRDRGRQAVGRGRHVFERRPARRGVRVRAPRAAAGPGDAGARSRPPRRSDVRVHVARRDDRVVRGRGPPPAAHRGARGRGAVPRGRAEGLERDAAQAQPGEVRAAVRAGARAARQPAGRVRGRRAVARARHLALVGRTRHRPRLADAGVLHDGAVHEDRRPSCACTPTACCATSTHPSGSCSASRCCSRWSRRGSRATTRTASCSATRCGRGRRSGSFREILGEDPDVTDVLDAARLDAVLRPEARALRTPAACSTRWTRWKARSFDRSTDLAATSLHRQGARALRGQSRPHADGRERPRVGVRRRAARPDPRQGPGADRAVALLVRADARDRRRTT